MKQKSFKKVLHSKFFLNAKYDIPYGKCIFCIHKDILQYTRVLRYFIFFVDVNDFKYCKYNKNFP